MKEINNNQKRIKRFQETAFLKQYTCWDHYQVDSPESHEPQDAQLDGDDGECDPEGAERVGDEDEGDDHHDHGGKGDALNSRR